MGSPLSCSHKTEDGDCLAWLTGSGMSGAPMTPSMSWSSPRLMEHGSPAPERSAAAPCDRIHALTPVQLNLEPREPPPENISSGMGTSSTVSSASSRSRFGHNFLMGSTEALSHSAIVELCFFFVDAMRRVSSVRPSVN